MIPFQVVRCVNTDQGTVQATDTGSDLNYYQLKTAVEHVLRFLAKLITLCVCLIDQWVIFTGMSTVWTSLGELLVRLTGLTLFSAASMAGTRRSILCRDQPGRKRGRHTTSPKPITSAFPVTTSKPPKEHWFSSLSRRSLTLLIVDALAIDTNLAT